MIEVMKIMVTSLKRSHARTVALSTPDPKVGHCRLTPLPETPGHSKASLGQSLVGSLLLSPGSWCIRGFFVPSKNLFPQFCVLKNDKLGSINFFLTFVQKKKITISKTKGQVTFTVTHKIHQRQEVISLL